jgi:hypothetical protein
MTKMLDLSGQKFGKLTVLKTYIENGRSLSECICDCGNKKIIRSDSLTNKTTKSCGCITKVDIIGNKYGRLTVIGRDHESRWLCKCDCGKETIVHSGNLKTGDTKSCGCKKNVPKGNLSKLLDETPEAYYWIGFLMADGHINHAVNGIILEISKKDIEHIKKYADFVECKNIAEREYTTPFSVLSKSCKVAVQDRKIVPDIIEKFGFKIRKTYNPCNLKWINEISDDLFLAFLVGFIDGDGCIGKTDGRNPYISIKIHGSWIKNLNLIVDKLSGITSCRVNHPYITKQGYARVNWERANIILTLKQASMNLPVLERKWCRILSP